MFRTEIKSTRVITQKDKIFCAFEHGDLLLIDSEAPFIVSPIIYGSNSEITHITWHADAYETSCASVEQEVKYWTCPREFSFEAFSGV